jgi:hypothetical protein
MKPPKLYGLIQNCGSVKCPRANKASKMLGAYSKTQKHKNVPEGTKPPT